MYLTLSIILVLVYVCYQDICYRAVYWICFPALAILLAMVKSQQTGLITGITDACYNVIFLSMQLILVWVYFLIKYRQPKNITNHYLGLGDLLFLLAIAFYLSPQMYVAFYLLSLILILPLALIQRFIFKNRDFQIPLAGLQAIQLSLLLILSLFFHNLKFYENPIQ